MKIIWKYLKPFKKWLFLSMGLAAIAQILELIDPIIFGKIIDNFAVNTDGRNQQELVNGVLRLLALAVGIALLARLAHAFTDYFTRLVVQKFGLSIFDEGLKQTLRLPYSEFEDTSSGHVLSLLQKVRNDNERFISSFISTLFFAIVGVAFLIWYSITKHWALIPVFLVGVVWLGGLTGLLSKKIKTIQRSVIQETNKMSGAITESLRNIEFVKSMGLTWPEIKRLRTFTGNIFNLEMQKVRKIRTLTFLQKSVLLLLKESILFILLWLIFRNALTTGELIAMQFISTRIMFPLQDLGSIILSYREAEASLQIFSNLMKKEPEFRPEEPVDIGEIEKLRFEDVSFRYRKADHDAIENLSFSAGLGETIAFVGPSGCGKSTLVKLLVGLYSPTRGIIYFDDVTAREIRYNRMRRQLGFVTQDTQLFSGSVRANMQFVKPEATDEEIIAALKKASSLRLVEESPAGLDTILGEGGKMVSGGEKQRLAIARALVRNPRILIFDEATSALDSLTEEEITDTLREISAGKKQIILMIAHRLSTIMHADRIYVLEKGKIVEEGNHATLLENKGLYYAMWRQQIGERKSVASYAEI
ncbi:MAG: ABC transporter ATP-binding protein [Bacteroidales bacterium]|nr:ABC transporter ATP-binding protein [Bacteroidales bacterium]NLD63626.1 ABC transporter ATP-binding protein [Bacteroidales bacterium]